MSVLIETSLGDLVIDLEVDRCPKTCLNFLKLCKVKYYNFSSFFRVEKDFTAQAGDPTGTGSGGESIYSLIKNGETQAPRYFPAEIHPKLNHSTKGTVSMAVVAGGSDTTGAGVKDELAYSGSQFFITLADGQEYLDGKHSVFGHIVEGQDVLDRINDVHCDEQHRPFRDVRIRHTIILDDPFPDPEGMVVPDASPVPTTEQLATVRLAEDESLDDPEGMTAEELVATERRREAQARALTLEMVGDLPFADIKPPENVLFVCKLNPVTRDEDLELIFSRFGPISSCEVIRDQRTGDSLCYAFVEFDEKGHAEEAYFKMDNVLVDDRRIKVDFSQSVSKLHGQWNDARRTRAADSTLTLKQQGRHDAHQYEMVFEHQDGSVTAAPRANRDSQASRQRRDDYRDGSEHRRREQDDRRPHRSRNRERSPYSVRVRSRDRSSRHQQHYRRQRDHSRDRSH